MSIKIMGKKDIRKHFREEVFKRDKNTCKVCNVKYSDVSFLDAHHITDRNEMPNGGYVKENGITVCVEQFHITNCLSWEEGLHPDDLYKKIKSSKELAKQKSNQYTIK